MPHRIFVVDDHAVMRSTLSTLIRYEADFDLCGVAASAEEALGGAVWDACDLLLTDISLPGMDGILLAERVRAEHPGLPVVVISATVDAATTERARVAGAHSTLSKLNLGDTLAPALREALRHTDTKARDR